MGTEPASRVPRGRPSRSSNAELELLALKGAISRFVIQAGPDIRQLVLLSKWHQRGTESEKKVKAEMLRLLRAKDCRPAL